MGTLAAGIKDVFSPAKTTGTNVMLCGNDGTPDGHISMANLANVFGASFIKNNTRIANNTPFSSVPDGICVVYIFNGSEIELGYPTYGYMFLIKWSHGTTSFCILINSTDCRMWVNTANNDSWVGWSEK